MCYGKWGDTTLAPLEGYATSTSQHIDHCSKGGLQSQQLAETTRQGITITRHYKQEEFISYNLSLIL